MKIDKINFRYRNRRVTEPTSYLGARRQGQLLIASAYNIIILLFYILDLMYSVACLYF
jgi:hypothetical protein